MLEAGGSDLGELGGLGELGKVVSADFVCEGVGGTKFAFGNWMPRIKETA